MIIILNGTCGVGKTTVGWLMLDSLYSTVMIDADYICATNPYVLKSKERMDYLTETVCELVKFHSRNNYKNFIISNVYESPEELACILNRPEFQNQKKYVFCLKADAEVVRQRIIKRNTYDVDWELKRFTQLQNILDKYSETNGVGKEIDTTNLSFGDVIYLIKKEIFNDMI